MNSEKLLKIIKYYGKKEQKLKAVEELSELTAEIMKDVNKGNNDDYVLEELADVWVMMNQLIIIYGFTDEEIKEIAKEKVVRTLERIDFVEKMVKKGMEGIK